MSRSPDRDRKLGDPGFIGKRGKAASQRRGRYDPGWTPTERRVRSKLMRQFIKRFDGPCGNSAAYLESPLWCQHPGCTRTNGTHSHEART